MVNDLTDGTANKGYRILVVDDEEDLCEILKFNLETEGYTVETANSAEEALTLDIIINHLALSVDDGDSKSRHIVHCHIFIHSAKAT